MIQITDSSLTKMKDHATSIFPDECCGFLFGKEFENGSRIVTEIYEVNNSKFGDKRRRFEIAAKDYLRAEQFAMENETQLIGVYHSHPNHPAIPSETDRVAAQPWFSYVIISVFNEKTDHIRSWRLNESSAFEEENFLSIHANQKALWQP
jgi:proteasome lid subunit RPN8/RPN11